MLRLFPLLALLLLASGAMGQPPSFGSADDPLELGSAPFSPDRTLAEVYGGPAFLRAGWRTGVRAEATVLRGSFSASVGTTLHPGSGGLYENEADDLYDALRTIRYIRVQPREERRGVYARIGPLQGVTLGTGMLARRYKTTAAWDERRIGAEIASGVSGARVAGFIGDITGGSVVGGEVEVPTRLSIGPARGLRLGLAAAHDLSLPASGDSSLTGIEATLRGDVFSEGGLSVGPYVSFAQVLGKGGGIGVGIEADGADLGSVARAEGRVGLVFSRGRFTPGIIGPLYSVSGGRQRIVAANSFYDANLDAFELAGTPIDSMRGGVDLEVDLRSVAFGRIEGLLYTRRHFGPRALSAFSLRLAARAGPTRFEFGVEKQGFRSLLGLFGSALGEENTLLLDISFPVQALGGAHAFVRSRYGYRRLPDSEAGPQRYLVERRFEPLIGVRTRW
ncbi:hypothetical protein [Rubricoccus marinus]|uniref:DUF5723 domain-containing protein n=1 Tax=Rubricoccus marinus TaxID=716817 RepID=A0A259TWS8_9BACT|nr:hypothetical protein [Rubricoccus marinus]OZC02146.1 hypothetical protein BSZ36_03580 [Rubricoccus marinus]